MCEDGDSLRWSTSRSYHAALQTHTLSLMVPLSHIDSSQASADGFICCERISGRRRSGKRKDQWHLGLPLWAAQACEWRSNSLLRLPLVPHSHPSALPSSIPCTEPHSLPGQEVRHPSHPSWHTSQTPWRRHSRLTEEQFSPGTEEIQSHQELTLSIRDQNNPSPISQTLSWTQALIVLPSNETNKSVLFPEKKKIADQFEPELNLYIFKDYWTGTKIRHQNVVWMKPILIQVLDSNQEGRSILPPRVAPRGNSVLGSFVWRIEAGFFSMCFLKMLFYFKLP